MTWVRLSITTNCSAEDRAAAVVARTVAAPVLLLILLFVWLPVLARVHERFSLADQPTKFRISRNLDRPYPKLSLSPMLALVARLQTDDDVPCVALRAASNSPFLATHPCLPPLPVRAPPRT